MLFPYSEVIHGASESEVRDYYQDHHATSLRRRWDRVGSGGMYTNVAKMYKRLIGLSK